MSPRVAVLHLGRARGMGEVRRVGSWCALLQAANVEAMPIALLASHPSRPVPGRLPRPTPVFLGTAVPETLAWCPSSLAPQLAAMSLDAIVCVTARAYHPALKTLSPRLVLDYVDRLSHNYEDRSRPGVGTSPLGRLAFRVLAGAHARFERQPDEPSVRRVAAGWSDARALGAEWIPNVIDAPAPDAGSPPDRDIVFFGNLAYPPNIEAVEFLSRVWRLILERRPSTTLLLAGSRPAPSVKEYARRHGWELDANFRDVPSLCRRARIAVAPLVHAAGIQNKVLEAAACGLPQVALLPAVNGFAPGFPILTASDEAQFVEATVGLLDDDAARVSLGTAARQHVLRWYVPGAWVHPLRSLLGISPGL